MRKWISATLLLLIVTMAAAAAAQAPAPAALKFKVGDTVPDFTLRDQNGKDVSLHDFRGKTVVLAFYVFAFSGG